MTAQYAARAKATGMRTDIDPEVVPTILIGAILYRLVSTGHPAEPGFADQVVKVLVRGLRAAAPSGARHASAAAVR